MRKQGGRAGRQVQGWGVCSVLMAVFVLLMGICPGVPASPINRDTSSRQRLRLRRHDRREDANVRIPSWTVLKGVPYRHEGMPNYPVWNSNIPMHTGNGGKLTEALERLKSLSDELARNTQGGSKGVPYQHEDRPAYPVWNSNIPMHTGKRGELAKALERIKNLSNELAGNTQGGSKGWRLDTPSLDAALVKLGLIMLTQALIGSVILLIVYMVKRKTTFRTGQILVVVDSVKGRANIDGQENVIGGDAVPMLGALRSVPEFVEMAPDMNYCMTLTTKNE